MFLTIDSSTLQQPAGKVTVQFDHSFVAMKTLALRTVVIHNSFYNYHCNRFQTNLEVCRGGSQGETLTFSDGFYTFNDMVQALKNKLGMAGVDTNKLDISIDPATGLTNIEYKDPSVAFTLWPRNMFGFKAHQFVARRMPYISDDSAVIYPFNSLYVHCNIINKDLNYVNSKPSDTLAVLDVIESNKYASKHIYQVAGPPKSIKSEFNQLKLHITDENGESIDFHDFPVVYVLELQ